MGGLSGKNDLQRLADDAAAAYIERAKLLSQLLVFQPRLTAMEMAVLWGYVVCAELQTDQKTAQQYVDDIDAAGTIRLLNEIRFEFFKTVCQDYITQICRSKLRLESLDQEVGDNFNPILNAISPDRRSRAFHLIFAIATNAAKLAVSTISILRFRLDRNQEIVMKRYAATLVTADPELNAWEKNKAIGWIASSSWVSEAM